jgi:hypothetical protein
MGFASRDCRCALNASFLLWNVAGSVRMLRRNAQLEGRHTVVSTLRAEIERRLNILQKAGILELQVIRPEVQ